MPPLSSTLARLTDDEREVLKLLIAALRVSEYTNVVDSPDVPRYDRMRLIGREQSEFTALLLGLCHAANQLEPPLAKKLKSGQVPTQADLRTMLARIFEIGRRYKRMNPTQFDEYGKLVMVLQDAAHPSFSALGLPSLIAPVVTVERLLTQVNCGGLLQEPEMNVFIDATADSATRARARATMKDVYAGENHVGVVVERSLRSVEDSTQFIESIRAPIARLRSWLDEMLVQDGVLAIKGGVNGSALTHSHEQHYRYVRESLILWDIIMRDIFEFWECVEYDLLQSYGHYDLCNTGQGVHRVCGAPKTRQRMEMALSEAVQTAGGWVGIRVIHLGDNDVPNALVFIDKYTVIPRLLRPIVTVLDKLSDIFGNKAEQYPGLPGLLAEKYGSYGKLRNDILVDFFKHAFDGSGDDGGSCIDGRLTSAWNWCHLLSKKPFYHAFVLAGFQSFD